MMIPRPCRMTTRVEEAQLDARPWLGRNFDQVREPEDLWRLDIFGRAKFDVLVESMFPAMWAALRADSNLFIDSWIKANQYEYLSPNTVRDVRRFILESAISEIYAGSIQEGLELVVLASLWGLAL